MATLMIIGAGPFQVPAIETASRLGHRVVAVDGNADAPGLGLADHAYHQDIRDVPACLSIARQHGIDGVLTVAAEVAVPTVSAVAAALGLPGVSPAAAQAATDKATMRELCRNAAVPTPAFEKVRTRDEAARAAGRIGFPIVIKPSDSAGSRGVTKVMKASEVEPAFDLALAQARNGVVLIEEFMDGLEFSLEGFVRDGELHVLTLSDKVRTPPPALLDVRVSFPSAQPEETQQCAVDVARGAVRAAGIDNATIHMEWILTRSGPRMVEMAVRGAGFHVFTEILPWVTGVDTVEQLIRLSLGQRTDFTVTRSRGCVLRFPEVPPGIVQSVGGVDAAKRVPGIRNLEIYVKPGDTVRPLRSGADRVGHIIAMAESRDAAMKAVEAAEAMIHIELAPATAGLSTSRA